jgi:hypothetical protein
MPRSAFSAVTPVFDALRAVRCSAEQRIGRCYASWRRLWLALLCRTRYFDFTQSRKEGRAMPTFLFFRHYRQRGPVNALQMRLQG